MIKKSKVPIICICNDRQSQKLKSLVLNALQMWASGNKKSMTYAEYSAQKRANNKDESLRVSLFDAAKLIVEGMRGENSFMNRYDAYFTDHDFMGLLVHQNYMKVSRRPLTILESFTKSTQSRKYRFCKSINY